MDVYRCKLGLEEHVAQLDLICLHNLQQNVMQTLFVGQKFLVLHIMGKGAFILAEAFLPPTV